MRAYFAPGLPCGAPLANCSAACIVVVSCCSSRICDARSVPGANVAVEVGNNADSSVALMRHVLPAVLDTRA